MIELNERLYDLKMKRCHYNSLLVDSQSVSEELNRHMDLLTHDIKQMKAMLSTLAAKTQNNMNMFSLIKTKDKSKKKKKKGTEVLINESISQAKIAHGSTSPLLPRIESKENDE
eukprot:TRINITY_DN8825_c0_g1_i5.p1 TRINITY_DN8825_c0_g1~~TRINITY_DN8825_c0_g1_i5.p1  ORF type:complete len:114 (-),score=12.48 TRINITY_DN8825_c0_g1_i5:150-491(-)